MKLHLSILLIIIYSAIHAQTSKGILQQQANFYQSILANSPLSSEQKVGYVNNLINIAQELKDTALIISSLKQAGKLCVETSNIQQSFTNYFNALRYAKLFKDTHETADILYDLAAVYKEKPDLDSALFYCKLSLSHDSILNRNSEIGNTYNLLGLILFEQHNYSESILFYEKAKLIFQQLKDSEGLGLVYANLGFLYQKTEKYRKASEEFLKASKYLDVHKQKYASLLNGVHNANSIIMEMQIKRQLAERRFLIIILILSLSIIIVVLRIYFITNKTSRVILNQKNKIEYQANELTESIKYAKRIQEAILVNTEKIKTIMPDSFIFFRPKDVVSGDFYWFYDNENYTVVAAIDCTGHGVPGAFMSIMGNSHLYRIIDTNNAPSSDAILKQLDTLTKEGLKKHNDMSIEDGMDMAVCVIDKRKKELQFSGANNPLVYIENNQLVRIKADRFPIGGSSHDNKQFTKHIIPLEGTNRCFYLFTDGFQDQFGGERDQKFMRRNFQELLVSIHSKPFEEQDTILDQTMREWKGNREQTDDILVIGFKTNI